MTTFFATTLCIELMSANPANQYFQIVLVSVGLIALIATVWWQIGTASNEETTENRPVTAFDSLDLSGSLHVLVLAGNEPSVSIRGSRQAVSLLRVRQYGNTLKIGNRFMFWSWQHHRSLFLTVTAPALRHVDISGASVVQLKGFTGLPSLELSITGVSNVTFDGTVGYLTTEITGASHLSLQGQGTNLVSDITGASSLQALAYPAEIVNLELTGACSAKVNVSKRLSAELAGASRVQYQGEPVLEIETSGASSISRI